MNKEVRQLESSIGKKNQLIERGRSSIRNTVDRLERLYNSKGQETDIDSAETKKHQNEVESIVSFIPGIGSIFSLCQSYTGKTCFSQEEISTFDRSLSGAGILLGGWAKVAKVTKGGIEGLEIIAKNSEKGRKAAEELSRLVGGGIKSLEINFTDKILKQIASRGWTSDSIRDLVDNPYTTRVAANKALNNNPATVFYAKDGTYVVVDDITKEVVQITDNAQVLKGEWYPDSSIINPYKP